MIIGHANKHFDFLFRVGVGGDGCYLDDFVCVFVFLMSILQHVGF